MKELFENLIQWLADNTPILCAECGVLHAEKNMRAGKLTTGQVVKLCPKCHQKYFGVKWAQ